MDVVAPRRIPGLHPGPERKAIYESYIPRIREASWLLGYCITVHGSLERDMDLVAIPWVEGASHPLALVLAIEEEVVGLYQGPVHRAHGRTCYTIHFRTINPRLYVDLSIMPRT